jgi:enoyl-CoA hydratase/carnithine racemase
MLEIINHRKIRELRLARPPVNALNPGLVKLLTRSIQEAELECEAAIISGSEGLFSAGLDVLELMQLDHDGIAEFWKSFFELLETVACSSIPVVAAITGHSPAGGAVVALFCDYRVMSRGDYLIGLNETRVGLVVPVVLQSALARLVGARTAELMVVTGAMIDPEKALDTGFVDALETGYTDTLSHALTWCEELLNLPRHSMLGNRANARAIFRKEFGESKILGVESFVESWFSDATQTVMQSLLDQLKNKKSDQD